MNLFVIKSINQSILIRNKFVFGQLKLAFANENTVWPWRKYISCCYVRSACEKYVKTPNYALWLWYVVNFKCMCSIKISDSWYGECHARIRHSLTFLLGALYVHKWNVFAWKYRISVSSFSLQFSSWQKCINVEINNNSILVYTHTL